jgi:hypothetical protein
MAMRRERRWGMTGARYRLRARTTKLQASPASPYHGSGLVLHHNCVVKGEAGMRV